MLKRDDFMEKPIKEVTITRTFNAPRELVYKAWTDPKIVVKWWGPRGVTIPICEMDTRPGGEMYIVMEAGKELGEHAGQRWPMKGRYKELTAPKKIVYAAEALDDKRGIMLEHDVEVNFDEVGDTTKMTLKIKVMKVNKGGEFALAGMEQGFNQQFDKLAEMLNGR